MTLSLRNCFNGKMDLIPTGIKTNGAGFLSLIVCFPLILLLKL